MGGWRDRGWWWVCGVIIMFTFTKLITGFSVGSVCGPGQAMKLKSAFKFLLTRQGRVQGQARW